jgi:WD40 repeat protein
MSCSRVPMGRNSLHVTGPSRSGALRARLDLPDVQVGAMQTSLIQNAHADLVTDTAYDFYGVRLATCSLDHRIKIWQLDESDGTWTAVADWKVRVPLSH